MIRWVWPRPAAGSPLPDVSIRTVRPRRRLARRDSVRAVPRSAAPAGGGVHRRPGWQPGQRAAVPEAGLVVGLAVGPPHGLLRGRHLKGTHGGLDQGSSLGFLIANDPGLRPPSVTLPARRPGGQHPRRRQRAGLFPAGARCRCCQGPGGRRQAAGRIDGRPGYLSPDIIEFIDAKRNGGARAFQPLDRRAWPVPAGRAERRAARPGQPAHRPGWWPGYRQPRCSGGSVRPPGIAGTRSCCSPAGSTGTTRCRRWCGSGPPIPVGSACAAV